ncbi:MAG: hypothetical protein M1829_006620 [Trizodia sp. TS-e1964]|nr:MAG: hypothetical protein M1829_006620 [Trizodia sp. TS-e1964]
MESTQADASSRPPSRASKRRKSYRKRAFDSDEPMDVDAILPPTSPSASAIPASTGAAGDLPEASLSVADILRRRRAAQPRKGGILYTHQAPLAHTAPAPLQDRPASTAKDEASAELARLVNRFAPQTGKVAVVDKHMMAYIDTELEKRRQANLSGAKPSSSSPFSPTTAASGVDSTLSLLQRQPAVQGKLQEIDLGPGATARNVARTAAAATGKTGGGEVLDANGQKLPGQAARDGKPWRGRVRRTSQDILRDRLVEEVLRESRIDIYDEPEHPVEAEEQGADDRVAEQFRREFMEAVSTRKKRVGAAATAKSRGGAKADDRPKGPKLGGSRSARAAMREQQEKAAKKR